MSAENSSLPESLVRARASLRLTNRWAYGAAIVGVAMMTQASWWVLGAALFFLIAIIGSIVVMSKLPAAKGNPLDWFFAIVLLCACSYFLLGAVGQLIFFNETNAYAECLNSALTLSRMSQCNAQLEEGILGMFLGN